jgi:hypothetical protein
VLDIPSEGLRLVDTTDSGGKWSVAWARAGEAVTIRVARSQYPRRQAKAKGSRKGIGEGGVEGVRGGGGRRGAAGSPPPDTSRQQA